MDGTRREFRPGFRVSALDGVVLVAAGSVSAAAFAAGDAWAEFGVIALAVTAHFFLFCNVFRIARAPELTWAAVFLALAGSTVIHGSPGWPLTLAAAAVLAAVLIVLEMRKPSYHGVGWRRINPRLPEWWQRNRPADQ